MLAARDYSACRTEMDMTLRTQRACLFSSGTTMRNGPSAAVSGSPFFWIEWAGTVLRPAIAIGLPA